MKTALSSDAKKRIRQAVKPGDPYALDDLAREICGEDGELRREFADVVADEYRRRLSTIPMAEARALYRRCYKEETDANKDWLLGEIVESIEAQGN